MLFKSCFIFNEMRQQCIDLFLFFIPSMREHYYASMHPRPAGEAIRDQQLTTNFADMFPYEDSKTVSVRLSIYPEKRNHHSFVNISPTLVIIDTSMKRSSRVLHHENPKI